MKAPTIGQGTFPRFWIIWSPQSDQPPRMTMGSESQARQVASKLALQHPGQSFFVMASAAGYIAEGVIVATATDPEPAPDPYVPADPDEPQPRLPTRTPTPAGTHRRARRETQPIPRPGVTITPE